MCVPPVAMTLKPKASNFVPISLAKDLSMSTKEIKTEPSFGSTLAEAIWLFAPPSDDLSNYFPTFNSQIKLILMPAFNPLLGNIINRSNSGLGPLLNKNLFKLNDALVFRLDGTNLGQLKTLKG